MASFFGDTLTGGGESAAKKASKQQQAAAEDNKKAAKKYKKQGRKDVKRSERGALTALDEAEAKSLEFREAAGEELTTAEQQTLAEYNAAKDEAIGTLNTGQDRAIGALDAGESGALNALSTGNETARTDLGTGFDTARAELDPYAQTGVDANEELAALQGLRGPEAQAAARARFQTDPGYQFRVSEGINALDKSATARGGIYSGAAMKAVQERGDELGSQEYGNYYNRTSGLADRGMQASGKIADLAMQLGVSLADLESRFGANAANVILDMAKQRGGVFADTANRIAGVTSDFGARSGAARADFGVARANNLIGSGQDALGTAQNKSQALLGFSGQRLGVNTNALNTTTGANTAIGDAQAAGTIGAANARAAGIGNALSIAGTVAGAAMAPIKPTSLIGRTKFFG